MRSPEKRCDPTGRTHDESPRDRQTGTERGPTTIHRGETTEDTAKDTAKDTAEERRRSRHVTSRHHLVLCAMLASAFPPFC